MKIIISSLFISASFLILILFSNLNPVVKAQDCGQWQSQTQCVAEIGCQWRVLNPEVDPRAGVCSLIPAGTCDALDSQTECENVEACQWQNGECSDAPRGCSRHGDFSECEADASCEWRVVDTNGQCTDRTSSDSDGDISGDINQVLNQIGKCGNLNQQCCKKLGSFSVDLPHIPIPIIGTVLDIALSPLEALLSAVTEGTLSPLSNLITNNLFGIDEESENFKCAQGKPAISGSNSCVCADDRIVELAKLCAPIKSDAERASCLECHSNAKGIWTGLGCFYSDAPTFIQRTLLGFMVGLAGLVALLCIIYSAFILQTSRGNPERVKKAREYLTNCILGLIVIIFSIFLLRLIGVEILGIPFLQ